MLGDKISFSDSLLYTQSVKSYWTAFASAIQPACVVSATTVRDVSKAVQLLKSNQCQFAIRSGGHDPWGSSNIQDGVTIDLSGLNDITVSDDQKLTKIGPGNRWQDIYLKLDALGLAVPGGRVATVGVGGLILGGGISFFSPRSGFVCDSVLNFDVVLSDGSMVNANATSHSDLWKALKGGSNNLGIVTSFSLKTFPQGKFLGGAVAYPITSLSEMVQATVDLASSDNYDDYAALIQNYAYYQTGPETKDWMIYNIYSYTSPVEEPAVFKPFMKIEPQLLNTMRISNLTDFTLEIAAANPDNQRTIFMTSTVAVDKDLLIDIFRITNETVMGFDDVKGSRLALTYQPIVTAMTKWGALNGGNVLGLNGKENLICELSLVVFSRNNQNAN